MFPSSPATSHLPIYGALIPFSRQSGTSSIYGALIPFSRQSAACHTSGALIRPLTPSCLPGIMIYFVHNTDNLKKRFKPRPTPPKLTHPPPAVCARRLLSVHAGCCLPPAGCRLTLPPAGCRLALPPADCRLALPSAAPQRFSLPLTKRKPLCSAAVKRGIARRAFSKSGCCALRVQLQVGVCRMVHYLLLGIRIDETEFPYVGTQICVIRIQFGTFGQVLHAL